MSSDQVALKLASPGPVSCKICGNETSLYGVVDFNKSCEEARGLKLGLLGVPVYYRRCGSCRFVFTDALDDWSEDEFKTFIYNDGYRIVDPDYFSGARAAGNADLVKQLCEPHKTKVKVLDYGGGNDALCAALRKSGYTSATTYDPMVPEYATPPEGKFDLITSFETLEHLPDPQAGIAQIMGSLADPGVVLFSTLLQPADFDKIGLSWWYAGPRNGHISLFSKQALAAAWGHHGCNVASFNDNLHIAFRTLPAFASHLKIGK